MSPSSKKTASAGNRGESVRSDCHVTLTLKDRGGLDIRLESKVGAMYATSIRRQAEEILEHFGVRHAEVSIEDSGALSFVIAARMESAIRQLVDTDRQYLPEMIPENKEGHKTIVRYANAKFDMDIDDNIFSLKNLRSKR